MPILADTEIEKRLGRDLLIHPLIFPEGQIAGCKVDIHLSGIFYEIEFGKFSEYDPLNTDNKEYRNLVQKPLGEPYVLHPSKFALASSLEHFSIPNDLLGILQGRSSLARMGILVHATAGFIDPNYKGQITFEFCNVGNVPVKLYPFNRVATVAFLKIEGDVKYPYGQEVRSPFNNTDGVAIFGNEPAEPTKFPKDWEHTIIARHIKNKMKQC